MRGVEANIASVEISRSRILKTFVLPAAAAGLPMIAAVLAALATETSTATEGVVGSVEMLSSRLSMWLGDFSQLLPLGFAFGAGMVATVNPCGFPMLPAYLAMYVASDEGDGVTPTASKRLARAGQVGLVVIAGFIALFAIAGIVIGVGARSVVGAFPWIGLGVGVLLAIAGAWLVGGGKLYSSLAQRAADRIGDPTRVNTKGFFLFGVAYATASLSCTLPIFISVTGISLASQSPITAIAQFLVYALGMGTVIMVLTLTLALFKGSMVGSLRKLLPYIQQVSAVFMILAGSYIVYYWLTTGGLLNKPI